MIEMQRLFGRVSDGALDKDCGWVEDFTTEAQRGELQPNRPRRRARPRRAVGIDGTRLARSANDDGNFVLVVPLDRGAKS